MRFFGAPVRKELQQSSFEKTNRINHRFGRITGKVLTNGGSATQFYVGRCADIGDMVVQSKIAVTGNAQVFNLACEFDI